MPSPPPPGWPDPAAPYEEQTDGYWTETVDSWAWEWRSESDDWIKSGSCPRCGHWISKVVSPFVLAEVAAREGGITIWCDCGSTHDGRPAQRNGCGARGNISPPPDAPPTSRRR